MSDKSYAAKMAVALATVPNVSEYPALTPDGVGLALARWEDLTRSVDLNDVQKAQWADAFAYGLFATLKAISDELGTRELERVRAVSVAPLAHPKPVKPVKVKSRLRHSSKPVARHSALKRGRKPRRQRLGVLASMVRVADALFSKMVREREPICVICKTNPTTDAAHHMPRTYFATRWWLANASGLCRSCHRLMTLNPLLWLVWWRRKLGWKQAEDVEIAARSGCDKRIAVEEFLTAMRKR